MAGHPIYDDPRFGIPATLYFDEPGAQTIRGCPVRGLLSEGPVSDEDTTDTRLVLRIAARRGADADKEILAVTMEPGRKEAEGESVAVYQPVRAESTGGAWGQVFDSFRGEELTLRQLDRGNARDRAIIDRVLGPAVT